jgi:hypothetical protein
MQIWLLRQGWVINYCVIAAMIWTSGVDLLTQSEKVVVATARCH